MDKDFPPRTLESMWGKRVESARVWRRLYNDGHLTSFMWVALQPWVEFTERWRDNRIPWKVRLFILWHGRLPYGF
jgi:hypothetical protein